jgi:hypothetical protein
MIDQSLLKLLCRVGARSPVVGIYPIRRERQEREPGKKKKKEGVKTSRPNKQEELSLDNKRACDWFICPPEAGKP